MAEARGSTHQICWSVYMLPPGSWLTRPGYQRHFPGAPVWKGNTVAETINLLTFFLKYFSWTGGSRERGATLTLPLHGCPLQLCFRKKNMRHIAWGRRPQHCSRRANFEAWYCSKWSCRFPQVAYSEINYELLVLKITNSTDILKWGLK